MTALAIFVKTPGYSPIKTRLAADVGHDRALAWYRDSVAAVVSVVAAALRPGIDQACFAVAEGDATHDPAWNALPTIAQGEGGLGERMARVHATLVERHGAALLIGADAPQIDATVLRHALALLDGEAPHALLGPATDGGFWLFGANRTVPAERWTRVTYSQADTAEQFRRALAPLAPWSQLPMLTDVDEVGDLGAVLTEARHLSAATPAQRECFAATQRLRVAASIASGLA